MTLASLRVGWTDAATMPTRGEARILRFGGGGLIPGHGERMSASLYRSLGVKRPAGVRGQSPPLELKAL